MTYTLILHLDAPLQSWGVESRYARRDAGPAPSKSAICGMVCAAMGVAKETPEEKAVIQAFSALRMTSIILHPGTGGTHGLLPDYHTVLGTRSAEGKNLSNAVLTTRFYHQSQKFAVLLESDDADFMDNVKHALLNPVWGIWFGRKCCVPAAPIVRDPICTPSEAREILHKAYPDSTWEIYAEVDSFAEGADTWHDQPVAFGKADSSGGDGRLYTPRCLRHCIEQGTILHSQNLEEDAYFQF